MLTQEEARELVCKSPLRRRQPSVKWIADRAAARARRNIQCHQDMMRLPRQLDGEPDWKALWEVGWTPMAGGASYFNLIIDTTAPGGVTLELNGNATYTTNQIITAAIGTSDTPTTGYQVLIWGDVDPAYNASIQTTQGGSAWITPGAFPANQSVKVSSGDALKTINIRVRDDVWVESGTVTKTITLDTGVPTVNITGAPDATKLSTVSGKRTVNFTFTVGSEAVTAWEVMLVSSGAATHDTGTLIGTTNGSTGVSGGAKAASATQAVSLDARDIVAASAGDGTKVIKVFVKDASDLWSTV